MRLRRQLAGILLIAFLAGCRGAAPPPRSVSSAVPDLGQAHPLNGRIWSVTERRFITEAALRQRLRLHPFVLLGEKHDNRQHHLLQARLLDSLVQGPRRPAVVWEMITEAEVPALKRQLELHPTDAVGLGPAIRWTARGWPDWSIYRPIAQVALAAKLPLVAAGVSRTQLMAALHDSPSSQPAAPLPALPAAARASLARSVTQAHCGHASERMVAMMLRAQQLRDVTMARALLAAGRQHGGAVLIAGAEHARRDRGAPFYLRALTAGQAPPLQAVSFVEVRQGERSPAAYVEATEGLPPPFDYLWFTRRVDNVDPCQRFRQQLKRMRGQHKGQQRSP